MQTLSKPDPRLLSALPYLTRGGKCIDVGTDHAYRPIHLIREGIVSHAMACDINEGPLLSAKEHITAAGLNDRINTCLTDGLQGLSEYDADDIMIFGMGGELIIKILKEAPWVRDGRIGLILQPMSRVSLLRRYLIENGFSILGESLSKSGKIYQTIYARYTGETCQYSEEELLLGRLNIQNNPPLFAEFVAHECAVCQKVLLGKEQSDRANAAAERRMLQILTERLEKLK